jgi:diadenosine tetraphosphate (Ap4A) HIT family hydrolase
MGWFELQRGEGCPFDSPRAEATEAWDRVESLAVSTLYLLRNQAYRGHCILIYDSRHASRPDELSPAEWSAYAMDLHRCAAAVMAVCAPDHLNVELLGNQMPHLHWHVIPRYGSDPRWGSAVWTTSAEEMPRVELDPDERAGLLERLREALA